MGSPLTRRFHSQAKLIGARIGEIGTQSLQIISICYGSSTHRSTSTATICFEAKLWLTADKLRNNMDAAEYKHVVLGLIFHKYIFDTFRRDLHPDLRAGTLLVRVHRELTDVDLDKIANTYYAGHSAPQTVNHKFGIGNSPEPRSTRAQTMKLNFDHLERCSQTLDRSLQSLSKAEPGSIDYEVFRNAVIKSLELTLETAGKLLRKVLKLYVGSPKTIDALVFKDVLRHAALHGLLSAEELERWLVYRDSRNDTAHNYGEQFAEQTLPLIANFKGDSHALYETLCQKHG
jgi:nucleotidyltransferase substrate binding protein (TIGR01987 family)